MRPVDPPRVGWLDTWDGRSGERVEVIGVGAIDYEVRALVRTRIGRGRKAVLEPGEVGRVPKYAVSCGVID